MRTIFQYILLLFTLACLGLCSYATYEIGKDIIRDLFEFGRSSSFERLLSEPLWIFPFVAFFGVFAVIFEIKYLMFENYNVKNKQLDDILLENERSFNIKKRYKMGFSLFCAGLLAFGCYIVPFRIVRGGSIQNEEFLIMAIPTFFAIAGYIYFFDVLKKQENPIKT